MSDYAQCWLIVMIGVVSCVLIISGAYLVYTFQAPITRWVDDWRRIYQPPPREKIPESDWDDDR